MYFFLICRGEAQTRELYVTVIFFLTLSYNGFTVYVTVLRKSNLIFQKSNQVFKEIIYFFEKKNLFEISAKKYKKMQKNRAAAANKNLKK